MKKCWVKIEVENYSTIANETKWVKAELINKKDQSYTVIYKKNGIKTVEDFDPDHFEYDKPKTARKKDPVLSRTKWWKIFFLMIQASFIAIFVAATPDLASYGKLAFTIMNWLILLFVGQIFDNVMEMIIRQEEIHKMLKESVSDDMKNCGNCGKSIDAFGACRDSAFGNSCDKWQFEPEYRG